MRGREDIHIMSLVIGSKQVGLFQTILGAALTAAGGFTTFFSGGISSFLVTVEVSMLAGGIMQMPSPQPKGLKGREAPENVPSYTPGDPVNTVVQGHPVSVLYGECRIGGVVTSVGIYVEDQLQPVTS